MWYITNNVPWSCRIKLHPILKSMHYYPHSLGWMIELDGWVSINLPEDTWSYHLIPVLQDRVLVRQIVSSTVHSGDLWGQPIYTGRSYPLNAYSSIIFAHLPLTSFTFEKPPRPTIKYHPFIQNEDLHHYHSHLSHTSSGFSHLAYFWYAPLCLYIQSWSNPQRVLLYQPYDYGKLGTAWWHRQLRCDPDALGKRECNRNVCCWTETGCGYASCTENFCSSFPDSFSCPFGKFSLHLSLAPHMQSQHEIGSNVKFIL